MRLRSALILVVPVFLLLLASCSGSSDPSPADRLQASVDANLTQYKQAHGLSGGGIAVYIETPTGNYFASSGMASGVDQNSRFRVASNTKTFTSAAIMLLAQQGKLNLDDYIVSTIPGQVVPYLPTGAQYSIPNKSSITIRQLLSHTAGVFDATNDAVPTTCGQPYAGQFYADYVMATDPYHNFTPGEFVGVDAACQLSYGWAPGTAWKYSNTGYSLLAIIIERVSGLSYDQFVMQNLIVPNGLASTSVPMLGSDQMIPVPFNAGYIWSGTAMTDVTQGNVSANIAEGNIISTPADLARWVKRLVNGQAGPNADSVAAMMTMTAESKNAYGLGMVYFGSLGYGHNGAHEGYLSNMAYDPKTGVTTILYYNVWDSANMFSDQFPTLVKFSMDARAAVGY
jgi:D-alanyl-D-alanine carboxypeptidase